MGGRNSILWVLQPLYWSSKVTGVLPLSYDANNNSPLQVSYSRTVHTVSLTFLILSNVDAVFLLALISKRYLQDPDELKTEYYVSYFGDVLFCIFIFCAIDFILNRMPKLLKMFQYMQELDSYIPLNDYAYCRTNIIANVIIMQTLALITNIDYYMLYVPEYDDSSILGVFQWIFVLIYESSQCSIELQFWCLCFLLKFYYISLNKSLENCRKPDQIFTLTEDKLNQFRLSFEILHKITKQIDETYGALVLVVLCLHNVYTQWAAFLLIRMLYDSVMGNDEEEEMSLSSTLMSFTFDCFRILYYFWLCEAVSNEVTYSPPY